MLKKETVRIACNKISLSLHPQLGRWHSIDKMAETTNSLSPYSYAGNNPVSNVDILGLKYYENSHTPLPLSSYSNKSLYRHTQGLKQVSFAEYCNARFFGNFAGSYISYRNAVLFDGFAKIGKFFVSNTNIVFHCIFSQKGGIFANNAAQKVVLNAIDAGLGRNHGFSFNNENKLIFSGKLIKFGDNLMFWALLTAAYSEDKIKIQLTKGFTEKETVFNDDGTTSTVETFDDIRFEWGGGRTLYSNRLFSKNKKITMYIMDYASHTPIVAPNNFGITYTQNTIFWHELGHVVFQNYPIAAIHLENEYRDQAGLMLRNPDSEHPPNPNFNWSINLFKP